jgi:predicted metal-dependent peptidase
MSDLLDKVKLTLMMDPANTFYSEVLCSMRIVETEEIEHVMQVTGLLLEIKPSFISKIDTEGQLFILAHEILHVAMMHGHRFEPGMEIKRWQYACDFWINDYLMKHNFKMPQGKFKGLHDPKLNCDLTVEQIYERIELQNQPDSHSLEGDLQPSDGDGEGEPEPSDGTEEGDAKEANAHAKQASQTEVEEAIVRAATSAAMSNQAGNVPGDVQRLVDDILNPKQPWYSIYQKYLTEKCKDDYSWARRNRRIRSVYLPSAYSEQMGALNFYIDASCSVSDEQFSMQTNQIRWVKNNINPKLIRIIVFNTRIQEIHEIKDCEPWNVEFHGRGGTCIIECVDHMAKCRDAEAHTFFTDGYFSMPNLNHIKKDIIWAIYDNPSFTAPKGKVIFIDD